MASELKLKAMPNIRQNKIIALLLLLDSTQPQIEQFMFYRETNQAMKLGT